MIVLDFIFNLFKTVPEKFALFSGLSYVACQKINETINCFRNLLWLTNFLGRKKKKKKKSNLVSLNFSGTFY